MSAKQTTLARSSKIGKVAHETSTGRSSSQLVRFEYHNQDARKVYLAGTFNDWRPESAEMLPLGGGKWVKDLRLPPGSYEYRLVVDGQWLADPEARQSVPNPFGGQNSVKVVPPRAPLLLADLPGTDQSPLERKSRAPG